MVLVGGLPLLARQYNFLLIYLGRSAKLFIEKLENFQLIAIFALKLLSTKNLLLIILLFVLSNVCSHHSLPDCLKIDEPGEFYFWQTTVAMPCRIKGLTHLISLS